MAERPINPYWLGGQFLCYCVKQGWLRQEGSGGRGTKWYPTDKGRKELKEKFANGTMTLQRRMERAKNIDKVLETNYRVEY
jgi:hypothetical protein